MAGKKRPQRGTDTTQYGSGVRAGFAGGIGTSCIFPNSTVPRHRSFPGGIRVESRGDALQTAKDWTEKMNATDGKVGAAACGPPVTGRAYKSGRLDNQALPPR